MDLILSFLTTISFDHQSNVAVEQQILWAKIRCPDIYPIMELAHLVGSLTKSPSLTKSMLSIENEITFLADENSRGKGQRTEVLG